MTESYLAAAREVNGVVVPVGEAFRAALRRDPALVLFAGDGFHPSSTGSYLAALVIYAQAAQRLPLGISNIARISDLPPGEIEALEGGASEAIDRFSSPWPIRIEPLPLAVPPRGRFHLSLRSLSHEA